MLENRGCYKNINQLHITIIQITARGANIIFRHFHLSEKYDQLVIGERDTIRSKYMEIGEYMLHIIRETSLSGVGFT